MTDNRKPSFTRTLFKIITIVPTIINLFTNTVHLIGYEARLAGRSLLKLLILAFMVASLLTTTWIGLLAMLFIYLTSLHWNMILSLLIISVLNILLLIIILVSMTKLKKNLTFPMTRSQFRIFD